MEEQGTLPSCRMEGKPKRLRPWLESLISSREIPGLQWENEEHTLFRIPWKHRGKHDWSPDNSRIFMEWAKQTGRYREGIDPPDYPAWKTRLRCAFNKAPDIEEVKDMSKLDAAYPYRVYRLKPQIKTENLRLVMRSSLTGAGHRVMKPYSHENRRNFQNSQMAPYARPQFQNIKLESVNGTGPPAGYHHTNGECRPPSQSENGYYHMNASHYNHRHHGNHHQQQRQFCQSTPEAPQYGEDIRVPVDFSSGMSSSCIKQSQIKVEVDSKGFNSTPIQQPLESGGCEMVVRVMYCGKDVLERVIRTPSGCRISYGSSSPVHSFGQLEKQFADLIENMYGPSQAETVALPPCLGRMTNEKQEKLGAELLERGLQRGVVLTSKDNDIYAYRLCQSAVFFSSQPGTDGKPLKLRRTDASSCDGGEELTKLFDYRDQYIPALKDYLDGIGDKPDPRCYLVFGQEVSMFKLDSSVLIVVSVASQAALYDLEKAEAQMSIRTPKVEVSNSTELDNLARNLMTLCQSTPNAQSNLSLQYSPTDVAPASTDNNVAQWFGRGSHPDDCPPETSTESDDGTQHMDDSNSQSDEL